MRHAIRLLLLVALSCRGNPETRPDPAATASRAPAPAAAPEPPAPTAAGDAGPIADAPPPTVAADTPCAADTDCAFDDPCDPQRCVAAARAPGSSGCEKSRPASGTCVCFEKRCSLKPGPNHPTTAVDADCQYVPGCVLDRAAGRCAPGRDDDFRRDRSIGPRCDCDAHVPQRCHFSWLDPIACTSVNDCWVDPAPFAHPIKRPRSKKGKTFRPCKDGEVAPACTGGRCSTVAYGC